MTIMLVGEAWGEIPLTKGYVALVDLEDFERINQYKWCAVVRPSGNVHAMRKDRNNNTIFMHHEVLGTLSGGVWDIDHENRNGIDNRKSNLKRKTRRENLLNCARSDKAKLYERRGNRFVVRVTVNYKRVTLGSFATREEAEQCVREYKRDR